MHKIETNEHGENAVMYLTDSSNPGDSMEVRLFDEEPDNLDVFIAVKDGQREMCAFLDKDDAVALARMILEKYDA